MAESDPVVQYWSCFIADCFNPAAIETGNCERCMKHFCTTHIVSDAHGCSPEPLDDASWLAARLTELKELVRKLNPRALLKLASNLNGGVACKFDNSDAVGTMGGMHFHIPIRFATGATWLTRIPRQTFASISNEMTDAIFSNECATLLVLEEIGIPAPRLRSFGMVTAHDHGIGTTFMLMEKLPGRPLNLYQMTREQKAKVYSQLAAISFKISLRPFNQIGSLKKLQYQPLVVGPVIGDRTGTLPCIGPFTNGREYYIAWAEGYLKLIANGQLYANYPINAYLIFKYLQSLASQGRWNPCEEAADNGPFFLKHMDDEGDHIMVDEEFNITGIIDWTFARIVPAYEAFGPSLLTANMNDIFNGRPGLSEEDTSLADLMISTHPKFALVSKQNDTVRRYSFALGKNLNHS